jgi:hypothetical protein
VPGRARAAARVSRSGHERFASMSGSRCEGQGAACFPKQKRRRGGRRGAAPLGRTDAANSGRGARPARNGAGYIKSAPQLWPGIGLGAPKLEYCGIGRRAARERPWASVAACAPAWGRWRRGGRRQAVELRRKYAVWACRGARFAQPEGRGLLLGRQGRGAPGAGEAGGMAVITREERQPGGRLLGPSLGGMRWAAARAPGRTV